MGSNVDFNQSTRVDLIQFFMPVKLFRVVQNVFWVLTEDRQTQNSHGDVCHF